MFAKPNSTPTWYAAMVDKVEDFALSLPSTVQCEFERRGDDFLIDVHPPSDRHRRLILEGSPAEFDYTLGNVYTEGLEPSPSICERLLAALDAVRDGKVKEVRDRRTGVTYHVYRLKTRGCSEFVQDGQYSLWHWLRLKIRNVQITSLPPLSEAC